MACDCDQLLLPCNPCSTCNECSCNCVCVLPTYLTSGCTETDPTDCVTYTGPDYPGFGVHKGDILTTVLKKILDFLSKIELIDISTVCGICNGTITTTTTTVPTTTTTTTVAQVTTTTTAGNPTTTTTTVVPVTTTTTTIAPTTTTTTTVACPQINSVTGGGFSGNPPTTTTTTAPVTTTTTTVALTAFTGSGRGLTLESQACSDAINNNRTFYSSCTTIAPGCRIYIDFSGTTVLTGYNKIYIEAGNWDINSSTGVIIGSSAIQC